MVRNECYWDFATSVRDRLREEINGVVRFEIYEPIDSVIFKIYFKDFNYSYGVNNIQDIIYSEDAEDISSEILSNYKKVILNSFFKSEDRKRREESKRLGISEEYV